MAPDRVLRLVRQAANSLAVAHEEGILHLDLKPEKIILTDASSLAERLTIIDFGISRLHEERSQKGGYVAGSPAYMAPEQRGGPVSTASDVYSLGMVVQEMLPGIAQRDPLPQLPVATREVLRDALATVGGAHLGWALPVNLNAAAQSPSGVSWRAPVIQLMLSCSPQPIR